MEATSGIRTVQEVLEHAVRHVVREEVDVVGASRTDAGVHAGADVLAVCCPYEVSRFEDALKVLGHDKRMIVRDVTELLAESLEV